MLEGGENDRISLTTVQDMAKVVALAVEYKGEWPITGGMRGKDITVGELLEIGGRVRGTYPIRPSLVAVS